jgi:hypothetical protein
VQLYSTCRVALFTNLSKLYFKFRIYNPIEGDFRSFVMYSS